MVDEAAALVDHEWAQRRGRIMADLAAADPDSRLTAMDVALREVNNEATLTRAIQGRSFTHVDNVRKLRHLAREAVEAARQQIYDQLETDVARLRGDAAALQQYLAAGKTTPTQMIVLTGLLRDPRLAAMPRVREMAVAYIDRLLDVRPVNNPVLRTYSPGNSPGNSQSVLPGELPGDSPGGPPVLVQTSQTVEYELRGLTSQAWAVQAGVDVPVVAGVTPDTIRRFDTIRVQPRSPPPRLEPSGALAVSFGGPARALTRAPRSPARAIAYQAVVGGHAAAHITIQIAPPDPTVQRRAETYAASVMTEIRAGLGRIPPPAPADGWPALGQALGALAAPAVSAGLQLVSKPTVALMNLAVIAEMYTRLERAAARLYQAKAKERGLTTPAQLAAAGDWPQISADVLRRAIDELDRKPSLLGALTHAVVTLGGGPQTEYGGGDKEMRRRFDLAQVRPLFDCEPAPFARRLTADSPTMAYRSTRGMPKYSLHWGQRKLLLSEIEFVTMEALRASIAPAPDAAGAGAPAASLAADGFDDSQRTMREFAATVIYVGAADGRHLPYLADLFLGCKFVLYDPRDFHPDVVAFCKKHPDRMEIRQQFFEDADAAEWSGAGASGALRAPDATLFISDIRNAAEGFSEQMRRHHVDEETQAETEENVAEDMARQRAWVEAIRPTAAMLKFRLPYIKPGDPTTAEYLAGDIYYQVWPGSTSSETRLVCRPPYAPHQYDVKHYEDALFRHNMCDRMSVYPVPAPIPGTFPGYDLMAEQHILGMYLGYNTNDPRPAGLSDAILKMTADIDRQLGSTLAQRYKHAMV